MYLYAGNIPKIVDIAFFLSFCEKFALPQLFQQL